MYGTRVDKKVAQDNNKVVIVFFSKFLKRGGREFAADVYIEETFQVNKFK